MPPPRPEIDYRLLLVSLGECLQAIESDIQISTVQLWRAYEQAHEAAGKGPMSWAGGVSMSPIKAISKSLDTPLVRRVFAGLMRNVDAPDQWGMWSETDSILRGVRVWALLEKYAELARLENSIIGLKSEQLIRTAQSNRARLVAEIDNEKHVLGRAA